jgi:undecaprenyl-diphosphatase
LLTAWLRGLFRWDWRDPNSRLLWLIMLGTVPAAAIGFLFEDFFEAFFGRPEWVSFFLLVTAGLLVAAERLGRRTRSLEDLKAVDSLIIGLGQAAAIAPGISRSGATIAAGVLRGLKRPAAARYSFLLSTPIILGAGLFKLTDLVGAPGAIAQVPVLVAGFLTAAIFGYLCIWLLLRYLQRGKLYPFAIYCVWVGVSCLIVAWLR